MKTSMVFSSCYSPTLARGLVTKADHREVLEIDGRSAADVYCDWVRNSKQGAGIRTKLASLRERDVGVLSESTLCPLARVQGEGVPGREPEYVLLHPESITPSRGAPNLTSLRPNLP